MNFTKTGLAQEIDRFGRALTAAAVGDDFAGRVEFVDTARQFAQWKQMSVEVANLIFVGFAHVENVQIVTTIQAFF